MEPDDAWRGVSDAPATIRARAASTPAQRLSWLEESLTLAAASGALARDRARRQREADAWRWDGTGSPGERQAPT